MKEQAGEEHVEQVEPGQQAGQEGVPVPQGLAEDVEEAAATAALETFSEMPAPSPTPLDTEALLAEVEPSVNVAVPEEEPAAGAGLLLVAEGVVSLETEAGAAGELAAE